MIRFVLSSFKLNQNGVGIIKFEIDGTSLIYFLGRYVPTLDIEKQGISRVVI